MGEDSSHPDQTGYIRSVSSKCTQLPTHWWGPEFRYIKQGLRIRDKTGFLPSEVGTIPPPYPKQQLLWSLRLYLQYQFTEFLRQASGYDYFPSDWTALSLHVLDWIGPVETTNSNFYNSFFNLFLRDSSGARSGTFAIQLKRGCLDFVLTLKHQEMVKIKG